MAIKVVHAVPVANKINWAGTDIILRAEWGDSLELWNNHLSLMCAFIPFAYQSIIFIKDTYLYFFFLLLQHP